MARELKRLAAVALAVQLLACGEPAPEPPAASARGGEETSVGEGANPTYEQSFVFASLADDSLFLVPWITRNTVRQDSVVRQVNGWLQRSGAWDAFYSETWTTPATRAPARLLPYGSLFLLVQEGDVVDGIVYEQGARRLEISLGDVQRTWGGPRGEAVSILDGAAYLSDERVNGLVVHLARASSGATPPGGDWGFLASGDSIVLVFAADAEHGGDREPVYRVWGEIGAEERVWTEVTVQWTGTQAFPPARRDVPVAWRLTTDQRQLVGELETLSADIEAGSGPGPLLPVRALYEVAGEVTVGAREYAVRGLLVHERR